MGVGRYNRLKRKSDGLLQIPKVKTFLPNPNESDYNRGYIVRYFAQKANDVNAIIYEISSKEYSKLKSSDLYVLVTLDWRIVGELDEIKKSNSASVRIASQTIRKLQLYLPNLLQFSRK